jgi:alkylation response protein AidB-like acyl-CoA dehydrogenase
MKWDRSDLKEEHRLFIATVERFIHKEVAPLAAKMDEEQLFPLKLYRRAAEIGLIQVFLPARHFEGGGEPRLQAILSELMVKGSLCFFTSLFTSASLFGANIASFGNPEQKERYLPPLVRGEKVGCWALTEPQAGSDALAIQATFAKNGDIYVINGSKTFITNAPIADFFIVLTREKGTRGINGGTAFILERGMEGLSTGKPFDKMGMRGSPTGEIFLENVMVSESQVLGEEGRGFRDTMNSLDMERLVGSTFGAIGVAKVCLEEALSYAKKRVQFGQPIANFQLIQEKLAEMVVGIEIAEVYAYDILTRAEKGERVTKEVAIIKLFSTSLATRCALEAIQIHGGYGYMKESPLERHLRDAKLFEIGGGTNEIMKLVIARELLPKGFLPP